MFKSPNPNMQTTSIGTKPYTMIMPFTVLTFAGGPGYAQSLLQVSKHIVLT